MFSTFPEAVEAGKLECRGAGEFCVASIPGRGYDFFPAGHPVGYLSQDGKTLIKGGTVVDRFCWFNMTWRERKVEPNE